MNINPKRKQKIVELYNQGVDRESLSLVTGYSRRIIDTIIRCESSTGEYCFRDAWDTMRRSFGLTS